MEVITEGHDVVEDLGAACQSIESKFDEE